MIVLIDLEHERLRSDTTLWRYFAAKTIETKYRLEEISGEHCLILDYRRATPPSLEQLNPRAVVVGGNYTGFQHFDENDLAGLKRFLVQGSRPTLAICGGFQLLVQVYGGTVGPMAPEFMEAKDGLSDTDTPFPPELLSPDQAIESSTGADERGFTPVRVIGRHRLFHGLPDAPVFYQLHGGEVKHLPDFFLYSQKANSVRFRQLPTNTRPCSERSSIPSFSTKPVRTGGGCLKISSPLREYSDKEGRQCSAGSDRYIKCWCSPWPSAWSLL